MAALLGYGEPLILKVFNNTLPSRLYWVLFPIENLRRAVETANRILTKEKIDRKLAGQSTATPFMSMQEGSSNNKRTISFDTQDMLDNKIDKLTFIMSKLSSQDSNPNRPFKPKIYPGKERGQGRNNYYERCRQWDRFRSGSSDIYQRSNYRDRLHYGQNYIERFQYGQNYRGGNIRRGNYRAAQNYKGQTFRREYRGNYRNSINK